MENRNRGVITTTVIALATAAIVFVATSSYYINNVTIGKSNDTYESDENFTKLKNVLGLVKKDFLFDD